MDKKKKIYIYIIERIKNAIFDSNLFSNQFRT